MVKERWNCSSIHRSLCSVRLKHSQGPNIPQFWWLIVRTGNEMWAICWFSHRSDNFRVACIRITFLQTLSRLQTRQPKKLKSAIKESAEVSISSGWYYASSTKRVQECKLNNCRFYEEPEIQELRQTSASQMRMVASSPALMMVLLRGPHITLLILPCGPVMVRISSLDSASS